MDKLTCINELMKLKEMLSEDNHLKIDDFELEYDREIKTLENVIKYLMEEIKE